MLRDQKARRPVTPHYRASRTQAVWSIAHIEVFSQKCPRAESPRFNPRRSPVGRTKAGDWSRLALFQSETAALPGSASATVLPLVAMIVFHSLPSWATA